MVSPKFRYLDKLIANLKPNNKEGEPKVNHTLVMGASGSGKDYLVRYMAEEGVLRGNIKFYSPWITTWQGLEEFMTFMFKSETPYEEFSRSKFKPTRFPIKVFFPVCHNMTDGKMPKDFFVPFTVSIDNLDNSMIKLLCSSNNNDATLAIAGYNAINKKGLNLPGLKDAYNSHGKKGIVSDKGFANHPWAVTVSNKSVLMSFILRLHSFDKYGVFESINYRHSLENHMMHEIKDQDTIVGLYLGDIKDQLTKQLVSLYFIKTWKDAMEKHGGERFNFKSVFHLNEIETFSKSGASGDQNSQDKVINQELMQMASTFRHWRGEFWSDVKADSNIDKPVVSLFDTKLLTRFSDKKQLLNIKPYRNWNHPWKEVENYHAQALKYKNDFRFIDLNERIPKQVENSQERYGYKLTRKKLTRDGKLIMNYKDWTKFKLKESGEWIKFSDLPFVSNEVWDCKELKNELKESWKPADDKIKEKAKKESEIASVSREDKTLQAFMDRLKKYKVRYEELIEAKLKITKRKLLEDISSPETFYKDEKRLKRDIDNPMFNLKPYEVLLNL